MSGVTSDPRAQEVMGLIDKGAPAKDIFDKIGEHYGVPNKPLFFRTAVRSPLNLEKSGHHTRKLMKEIETQGYLPNQGNRPCHIEPANDSDGTAGL